MEWLGKNWGNLLSAIGLIVTLLTFRAATKARDAAQTAEKHILIRSLSQELDHCQSLATEMYDQLAVRSWATAGVRCRDLSDVLHRVISRWSTLVQDVTLTNLTDAQERIIKLERVLVHVDPNETTPDSIKVIKASREIKRILIEEKARMERELDKHGTD